MSIYGWIYVIGFVLMAPYTTWQYFRKLSGWSNPLRGAPTREKINILTELTVFYLFWVPSLLLMIVTVGMVIQERMQECLRE